MITIVKPQTSLSRQNLTVQCACGRSLRAKVEQAGTEIACWECHRKVLVPVPRSAEEALRALRLGWNDVFETPLFAFLVGLAVVLTGLLAVPRAGVALGAAGFTLLAFGYGEIIRRVGESRDDEDDGAHTPDDAAGPLRWLARGVVAVLFGACLSAPFLLARRGPGHPAQLAGVLVPAIAFLALGVLPLGMLAAFAPAGPRVAPAVLRWRWRSVLSTLAVVPLILALTELAVIFISFFMGFFGGLMIDLIPTPPGLRVRLGVAPDWLYHFGEPADIHFLNVYFNRLSHGYTLLGAIPPSLILPRQSTDTFWASSTESEYFYYIQIALTLLITTCVLSALAFQACWLGRLARVEGRLKIKSVPAAAAV